MINVIHRFIYAFGRTFHQIIVGNDILYMSKSSYGILDWIMEVGMRRKSVIKGRIMAVLLAAAMVFGTAPEAALMVQAENIEETIPNGEGEGSGDEDQPGEGEGSGDEDQPGEGDGSGDEYQPGE